MKIWQREINLALLNARGSNTLAQHCGIVFISFTDTTLSAQMPVDQRTTQALGWLHGGASCALAESVASTAANFTVPEHHYCVGLALNINHLKAVRNGPVSATCTPCHLGGSTQVWEIKIHNPSGLLVATSTLTVAVRTKAASS